MCLSVINILDIAGGTFDTCPGGGGGVRRDGKMPVGPRVKPCN